MDLYKNYMPYVKVSNEEKVVSRNCKIGYTQVHFPIITIR